MTPAEYNAHVAAWYRKERREQSRVAMLCVMSARGGKSRMEDFMGAFAEEEAGGGEA